MSTSRLLKFAFLLLVPSLASAQAKVADVEKLVKADSNDANNHAILAITYAQAKRWPDAEREAKAALALDPRSASAHLTLAMAAYADRKALWNERLSTMGIPTSVVDEVAESDKHYKMAFLLDPMVNTSIISMVATVNDSSSDGNSSSGTDMKKNMAANLVHGVIACNEGRYPDCKAAFAKYFSANQGSSVARIPKAVYWYNAIALLHEKDYSGAAASIGVISNRKDDDTRAMAPSEVAKIPLMTNDLDAFVGSIQFLLNNNALDAQSIFQKAVTADPTMYLAHVYMAKIAESQRNYDKAIAEWMEAMKGGADDPQLHADLGLAYAKSGKFPEAIQHLGVATKLMPRNATAWYYLGLAKEQSKDVGGAKEAYGKAVAMATVAQTKLPFYAQAKAKM